ncbi:hypothetical protein ACFOVU_17200 [Nocardiopsis sediminis]|uniref:Uncharacterized protein n=1 Tax=Nocardiopsis sediminis TaxID=1778267 RepID=A0ABV8FNE9_9ACTN
MRPLSPPPHGPSRRRLLTGAAGAAVLGAAATTMGAPAAHAAGRTAADPIEVVLLPDEFTVPERVPSGLVTFHVSTPEAAGRSLLLVRLREGATVDEFLEALAGTNAQDPAEKAAAARRVTATAENLGGAVVAAGTDASFTQLLGRGGYLLVNFGYSSAGSRPMVREIRAGAPSGTPAPGVHACIAQVDDGEGTAFEVSPGRLPARGTYSVVNTTATPQEAMVARVREGTTAEDVRAYFDALRNGEPPGDVPVLTRPVGLAPLAGDRWGLLHTEFEPGPYVLFSFTIDHDTGYAHALQGMFRMITLV